ncbi:3-methyl-2-oxobutanoate hydroxymethyltransferase [Pseudoteredinibacter isoporae]|uniref:3-methyl-2-oxobutanoate hydroxymethyltransferase n=1 Tax=Pseudoteredinibacter isoporae TaxID=570281 RepID=A0A7X0MVK9_9GAMM|nr:3-methyl-2-oxobutanoate hydroxymethyltransferase [Pseudoteredinibacter isoporae]MBB6521220.1 3-methyl-2-oxobutanoate hydroxymethyltransferase [Pseudoteredinibacter isoporae]NHO86779.1 3-methyl-2-oxobutanoate hydroxymethyltransferase [Pseudoteredinibacter isoporae]NIB24769.1 3-methyl-2-oxobutanoate hydroxymethyltransferase [Pseudoteredinibacter isoporae]
MPESIEKMTVPRLQAMKDSKKLVMLTAYDYTMARLLDPHVDILLVGDTLGCVVQGGETTLGVTLEQMSYHAAMVKQGAQRALVVADLPFGTYQQGASDALEAAITLVKDAKVSAVKLEGGEEVCASIEKISQAGIPVMAHLGLTPQSYHAMGGNKVQGKSSAAAKKLLEDARAVEAAGAFALVLEAIPAELAAEITEALSIPTIGIGAGTDCSGQVLVINDLIGLNQSEAPMRFNKEYCAVRNLIEDAAKTFANEVRAETFPDASYSY